MHKFTIGSFYHLKHVLVKSYNEQKYLEFPKQGATFEKIDNIGAVADDDVNTFEQITNSEIVGMFSFDNFLLCQEQGSPN